MSLSIVIASQFRAARNALNWRITDAAKVSGVSIRTIKSIEAAEGLEAFKLSTIEKLKTAFERHGIEFIGTPDDAPGIRIHKI